MPPSRCGGIVSDREDPPVSYAVHRVVLIGVVCLGLLLLGLVMVPAGVAIVEFLGGVIGGMRTGFTWELF
jgi:hypothetical protein